MIHLQKETVALLEDLERRLDTTTEDDFIAQWRSFLFNKFDGEIFTPYRKNITNPNIELPSIHINDALDNLELMLQAQLVMASNALSARNLIPCIRANYGTGILSSLFGAELFIMPRETNTLPTTKTFNDTEKIRSLIETGIPALTNGLGQRVFDFGEFCAEALAPYPLVKKYVQVYHPDTQGPLDIAELLWGGDMFYAMYDEPDLVHSFLKLISDTYTAFLEKWFTIFPSVSDMNCHWSTFYFLGHILIRNDSAMNLTPDFYKEFALPYDSALLKHFNGGAVHFCGRGDHYIESLCSIPELSAINMSQPHLNDMETIYRNTVDKGVKMLDFSREYAQKALTRPNGLNHNVHCL